MRKRVIYGEANYEGLIRKNGYFVDKTPYIETLETVENPVFLRPRRFGKSLFCRMLECYYNIRQQDQFEELFGQTYIGKHPTPTRNSYFVLHLDFSIIDTSGSIEKIAKSFHRICNSYMDTMLHLARQWFQEDAEIDRSVSSSENLSHIVQSIQKRELPQLYVIIDEYDNFANQLITEHKDHLYRELTASDSFLKTFFKTLKEGRKSGQIANIFITGVLPITIDDLASGFNIAGIITLEPEFEQMMGFTQSEVDRLLDEVYEDYHIEPLTKIEIEKLTKAQYSGYHFIRAEGKSLYDPGMLMYFLSEFYRHREILDHLTEPDLASNLSWERYIIDSSPGKALSFVKQLLIQGTSPYDSSMLHAQTNVLRFSEETAYPILFYHLGMLTKQDQFNLKLPNLNIRKILTEYVNKLSMSSPNELVYGS